MNDIIFDIIDLVLALGAFIYGAIKLFHKGKPMYFQILICAVGCFTLQELSAVVTYLCNGFEEVIAISILGIIGCVLFILTANRGALDDLVDENYDAGKKARLIALIGPLFVVLAMIFVLFTWVGEIKMFAVVTVLVILATAIPASYYSLKHLLLPKDSLGILSCTRACNAFSFAYLILAAAYCISFSFGSTIAGIVSILCTLCIVGIAISSVKGADKWII